MYLIDTNVLSDARKRVAPALAFMLSIDPATAYVSVITLGEIERGIIKARRADAFKSLMYERWLKGLRRDFAGRILPVTEDAAIAWGRISAGRTRSEADALIAATALAHDLILVTRNVADFEDTGVTVLNPWSV